jgi:hypothetical protein
VVVVVVMVLLLLLLLLLFAAVAAVAGRGPLGTTLRSPKGGQPCGARPRDVALSLCSHRLQ